MSNPNKSLKIGDWNAICDVCGFEYKASQLKKRWDGLMVCEKDFEHRHPSDLYRFTSREKSPPWTRPEPPELDGSPTYADTTVGNQETTVPSGTFNSNTL